jgi:tetratricopeptide (TPR) repeat protein
MKDTLKLVEGAHLNKRVMNDILAGRYSGIGDLKYTLDKFPNHPKALMLLGMGARLIKDPLLATTYYQKTLRLYPQHAFTHAQYGAYLADIGQVEEGISRLQKAIEIDPKLAVAYAWLSNAYAKIGNREMARQSAEKAKELGLKTGQ